MGLLSLDDDLQGSHDLRSEPVSPEERARNIAAHEANKARWAEEAKVEKEEAERVRLRLLALRNAFDPKKFVETVKRLRDADLAQGEEGRGGKVHPLSALQALGLYNPADKACEIFWKEKPWRQCREIIVRTSPGDIWLEVRR